MALWKRDSGEGDRAAAEAAPFEPRSGADLMTDGQRHVGARVDLSRVEELAGRVLRDWLSDSSPRRRAAGEYYLSRLSRESLLVPNDLAMAEYCRRRFSGTQAHAVEMGTGFGELSLLLALSGIPTIAFESDFGRHSGAEALLSGLAACGIDVGDVSLVYGTFPLALDLRVLDKPGPAVFLSSNVTSSWVMEHIDSVHRALRLFDHLVIDLARFGIARNDGDIRSLVADLERDGFTEVARVYAATGSDVRHFARRSGPETTILVPAQPEPDELEVEEEEDVAFATELRWADTLDRLLVPGLQHRIAKHGSARTGAYNFYAARLEQGVLLQDYEIAVARALLERRMGITHIDEVGSGFGELVFLLAWNGFRVRGFEADLLRAQAARRLRRVLELADPELTRRAQLVEENFPSSSAPPPRARSLLLTTNLVATRSPEQQAEIVRAMREYSFALVDIQRLFDKRDDAAAIAEGLALFEEAGFAAPELFLDLGQNGRYLLFCWEAGTGNGRGD